MKHNGMHVYQKATADAHDLCRETKPHHYFGSPLHPVSLHPCLSSPPSPKLSQRIGTPLVRCFSVWAFFLRGDFVCFSLILFYSFPPELKPHPCTFSPAGLVMARNRDLLGMIGPWPLLCQLSQKKQKDIIIIFSQHTPGSSRIAFFAFLTLDVSTSFTTAIF